MVGDVHDVITCAKFQLEIYRNYDFTAGRIFDLPIYFLHEPVMQKTINGRGLTLRVIVLLDTADCFLLITRKRGPRRRDVQPSLKTAVSYS